MAGLFFAGGPVTSVDWCPTNDSRIAGQRFYSNSLQGSCLINPERNGKQYLAVAVLVDTSEPIKIGMSTDHPSSASIQLWSLSPSTQIDQKPHPIAVCELVMCIEEGSALQLKWCPLPSHDMVRQSSLWRRSLTLSCRENVRLRKGWGY